MTLAWTQQLDFSQIDNKAVELAETSGAHTLLAPQRWRPSYVTQAAAVGFYVLALAGLCYLAKPKPAPQDQPIELTMVTDDAPVPADNPDTRPTPTPLTEQTPTPPLADPTPPQQTALATPHTPPPSQDLPPPPTVQQEVVAPLPPPPAPAKHVKPKQRSQAVAARAASSRHSSARSAESSASNALPSYYANEVHERVARVAGETVPDDFHGNGRVTYHLVISPSGALISKSITSSGNSVFDRAAEAALTRAAPFPPTGMSRPVSLRGAIAYRQ